MKRAEQDAMVKQLIEANRYTTARLAREIHESSDDGAAIEGLLLFKALRAAIRAALPGRQQKQNLAPFLRAGVKAAVRALRRAK